MQVCSREEKKEPMYVDLQSDKITIFLSEKDFNLYDYNHNADEKFAAIFHSCMVLPALTYAVERMIEDPESYEDKKWYQILQFRKKNEDALNKVAWQKNNAMRVAQAILDRPLTRTLESVKGIIDHLNSGEI
jgi:hypothetical protein